MSIKYSAVFVATLLLAGCEGYQPPNYTPKVAPQLGAQTDAELGSIIVSVAQPSERKGAIHFAPSYAKTFSDAWRAGLKDAISHAMVFSPHSLRRIDLRVSVLEFDQPNTAISFHTKATALYEIEDRETGAILFREEIASEGVAPWSFALSAEVRSEESGNRAVQNNILSFLGALGQKGVHFPKRNGAYKP